MTTTVMKLKARVNNDNLPYLRENGSMDTYCVGRYLDKLAEVGYTPTNAEETAIRTFVNSGIEEGWINKIRYFLPLIGSSAKPDAVRVPLIDKIADYELPTGGSFTFSDGGVNIDNAMTLPFTLDKLEGKVDLTLAFNGGSEFDSSKNIRFVFNTSEDTSVARVQVSTTLSIQSKGTPIALAVTAANTPGRKITTVSFAHEDGAENLSVRRATYWYNNSGIYEFANAREFTTTVNVPELLNVLPVYIGGRATGEHGLLLPCFGIPANDISADEAMNEKYLKAVLKLIEDLGR